MDFSIWPNPTQAWDDVVAVTRYGEDNAWHGIWFADHFMPNTAEASGPTLECFSVLAGLAAITERVRIGSLVAGVTYRHPAVLANIAAAIDQISHGRLVLGIGAGWQENEHEAYGIELGNIPERLQRFDEACAVIISLLRNDRTDFDGHYFRVRNAPLEPKPVQDPMPILIGAKGEKVALGIVARHADEWNAWGTPDTMAVLGKALDGHCDAVGRDPTTIRRSANAFFAVNDDAEQAARWRARFDANGRPAVIGSASEIEDTLGAYADASIDEIIVPDWAMGTGEKRVDDLERLREVFMR